MNKILLLFVLLSILITGCLGEVECRTNDDCAAATCCHADSCVAKENAPNCSEVSCSMECKPYTMDCGQGSCVCENNKCVAQISN